MATLNDNQQSSTQASESGQNTSYLNLLGVELNPAQSNILYLMQAPNEVESTAPIIHKVLDRDANEYFTDQVLAQHQLNIDRTFQNLNSKSEIKDFQRPLANKQLYNIYLPTSKNDIYKLQKRLITLGHLSPEINGVKQPTGILETPTIQAWNNANVDGILGPKTKQVYIDSQNWPEANWGVDIQGEADQCARFVSKKIESATGISCKNTGVYGNAWNMLKNIVRSGGQMLFNIYEAQDFKNLRSDVALKKATQKYISNNPLNYSMLNVGDVVGIYVPSSGHHYEVLAKGDTYNTHVGVVVGKDANGQPIIEHTVGGNVYQDPINNIRGSKYGKAAVTVAARPRYQHIPQIKLNSSAISNFILDPQYVNRNITQFMEGMAQGAEAISELYPNVPIDLIQKIALAVQKRETNFMNNRVSDQGQWAQFQDKVALKIRGENQKSTNTSKMKLASLTPDERSYLGIRSKADLENPKLAGLAALLYLTKNYDYLQRLQQTYPDLGLTEDDLISGTILSYNQGMGKLYSLGFDTETGAKAEQELEALRKLSEENALVRDVSSTKYRFFGPIGTLAYNLFEDPSQPYISAALEAMKKYIKSKKQGGVLVKQQLNYFNLF